MLSDAESLQEYVTKAILNIARWSSVQQTEDFFSLGMDLLQVLRLARQIRPICSIGPSTIYTNPTVALLAQATVALASDDQALRLSDTKAQHELISSLLTLYQDKIDAILAVAPVRRNSIASKGNSDRLVLLTGLTGTLGSYILHSLLQGPTFTHIYCLNRSQDSDVVQTTRNKARELLTAFPAFRVTFITSDLVTNSNLGLEQHTFISLKSRITYIIHNAWTVAFNLSLSSFSSHLAGIANLVKLAA